jgi:hypothetical protein
MRANRWPYFAIATLGLGAAVLLGWQRQVAAGIRGEIVREQRARVGERLRLAAENRRLAAAQLPPAELEKLRADRSAVTGLLAELEAMKRRAGETARTSAKGSATVESGEVAPSMEETAVPADGWRNAGTATPAATFETALWASAGGEIDVLAGLLVLDAAAQAWAESILTRLPSGMRQELGTPERLLALLTAVDVPLGSAQILGQYPNPAGTRLLARLVDPEGKPRQVLLSMQTDDGKWRFKVSESVVAKYTAILQAPTVVATGTK